MTKFSFKKKLLAGIVVTSMVFAIGTTAFAVNNGSEGKKAPIGKVFKGGKGVRGEITPTNALKTRLDALVTAGTITQAQEDSILQYVNEKDAERKAEMEKVKNMTKEERDAYFKDKTKEKFDLFSELVSKEIITQAQADEISKNVKEKASNVLDKVKDSFKRPEPRGDFLGKIKSLIDQGTITQWEYDKITEYIKSKDKKTDLLAGLVSDGIITQEKADAISKLLPTKPTNPIKPAHQRSEHKNAATNSNTNNQ
jgi:competence protein ComGC